MSDNNRAQRILNITMAEIIALVTIVNDLEQPKVFQSNTEPISHPLKEAVEQLMGTLPGALSF